MLELVYILLVTHITIICVTLFLHRGQAHRGITFHPLVSHFMRFWLWLTTGMITKEWVAVHRMHHRFCETWSDPHSPHTHGILKVLFKGALLYNDAAKNSNMVKAYGVGTPSDWIERHLYAPHSKLGITILLLLNIVLFGWIGIILWGIQMIWIPFWAAGVINGIGHWFGYRNSDTKDKSKNIIPFGILIGGEELHNNHHNQPANVKLSMKWWEIDIGWTYLRILCFLRLAKINVQ